MVQKEKGKKQRKHAYKIKPKRKRQKHTHKIDRREKRQDGREKRTERVPP